MGKNIFHSKFKNTGGDLFLEPGETFKLSHRAYLYFNFPQMLMGRFQLI